MQKKLFLAFILLFLTQLVCAAPKPIVLSPQPTTCVVSSFSNTGGQYWKTISLQLTNKCGQPVDFQNSTITFLDQSNLNQPFWGNFSPLSYPDNTLQITSQPQAVGNFLSSLSLHFPSYTGSNSVLPNGSSITIIYGAPAADYIVGSTNVYLNTVIGPGQINLVNNSSQPANVTQNYAVVNVTMNGNPVTSVQLPWSGQKMIPGLAPGVYNISAVNVSDSSGNAYQGTATPASVSVATGQTVTSTISYTIVQKPASINIQTQALPSVLNGYTGNPSVTLKRADTGASTVATANWNMTTTVNSLANGVTYNFSTPTIVFNGNNCVAAFTPTTVVASSTNPTPTTQLTYTCTPVAQDKVTFNVTGAPSTTSSVTVTLTPNNGSSVINQAINLSNGQGSSIISLADGVVFTVSSTPISGYSASFSLQPLTAAPNGTENITYTKNTTSAARIVGYLPGWLTPPTAAQLSSAGYTNVLIAFGVFSTTSPGQISSGGFTTITPDYIKSLQAAGIKVSLSVGGASSSVPDTTVSFDQVLQMASSPSAFQTTFIQSLQSLVTQYNFDGVDFDIESGLNGGGTFTNPQGDIAVLANIINTLHSNNPAFLISLAPQTANIAATQAYNETWANYSALIMQSANSLSWVGVQLYNTGCMLGIDDVCYDPNLTSSPNFSTAMATDLLENWPAKTPSGQATGFQPYISMLNPSQVVLGYVAPNSTGQGDGAPVVPNSTIKRAIQCLRTNVAGSNSCDTYVPPKAYPNIGGVFDWQINNDQNNNFNFAMGLKNCVLNGTCS